MNMRTRSDEMVLSVVIPTRNRCGSLEALLASLARAEEPQVPFEIIVADNGSDDATPQLLQNWSAAATNRRVLRVPQPGRSRALNEATRVSEGHWIAFLDDDVVVAPDYLVEITKFIKQTDCVAAQGTIQLSQEAMEDPSVRELVNRFKAMFPTVVHPPDWRPKTLTGANMLVRRDVLLQVGLYDERLGPGASGFAEDDDLADRILQSGGRIGYMPRVKVTHEINRDRLTLRAYLYRARKLGHGDYIRKQPGVVTWILPRLAVAGLRVVLATVLCLRDHRHRALARWQRYAGALEAARQRSGQ